MRLHSAILIAIMALVTIIIRFAPFIIFKNKTPDIIKYLGGVLPFAIMPMLIVYCLKGINFSIGSRGIPELVSCVFVVILHKWKHNTLISILLGTICYMLLIQVVFA